MSKPKIAVLIDWYLPGTKAGGPVRSVYSLLNLLKHDFDFYLITTNQDLGSPAAYADVAADQWLFKDQVHYYYFSKAALSGTTMLTLLNGIQPDLVYLNSFWSFHFSINLVKLKHKGLIKAPVLLAPRGMLGKGALSLKPLKKQLFLTSAKLLGWYKSVSFHATNAQEQADTRAQFPLAKVFIAPNINSSGEVENKSRKVRGQLSLFFLSRVARVKNLHMALEVLQTLPPVCQVSYHIFGNLESAEYWEECKKIIAQLPEHIQVIYKGELAFHEVQHTICHYNALLMPTLNENFGHSIVESLLCGCPAVISDQTPWNDLEANNAGYALPLEKKQRFATALMQLADLDEAQFSEKSKAAIAYIRTKIDLPAIHAGYKKLLNDCIQN